MMSENVRQFTPRVGPTPVDNLDGVDYDNSSTLCVGRSAMREENIGGARLILGDCRDVLPTLTGIDSIISDPPYGIDYNHSGQHGRFKGVGVTQAARDRGNHPIVGDGEPFDPAHMLGFDNVLLWGADHYRDRLPAGGRFLAFDKLAGMPTWDSFSDVEFGWHSKPGASRIFSMKWKGIACDKRGENNGLREHPTQKPIALMAWCIRQAGNPRVICDPYMGVGTTGVAALRAGCGFVGIEIDLGYFDIACRRIEAMALPLFDEAADARESYDEAVREVGKRVRAGEPLPDFFKPTGE